MVGYKVVTSRMHVLSNIRPPLDAPIRTASWTKAWSQHIPETNEELHRQHLLYLLKMDWSKTPMGPLEEWPQSLRTMSSYVLNCPFPCAMYWGEELAVL